MRLCNIILLLFSTAMLLRTQCVAQGSIAYSKLYSLPDRLFSQVSKKTARAEARLIAKTDKYLNRLLRKEQNLQRQLWKKDSASAKALFGDAKQKYEQLRSKEIPRSSFYSGHLDSMETALKFFFCPANSN